MDALASIFAARIALIVLRATLPPSADGTPLMIRLGNGPSLSAAAAAEELARLPKPLVCRADVKEQVMVVTCEPDPLGSDSLLQQQVSRRPPIWGARVDRSLRRNPDSRVLVSGPDDSALVPADAFHLFGMDYEVNASFFLDSRRPSREERRAGALAVVYVGRLNTGTHFEL